jgi:hypothetical protein
MGAVDFEAVAVVDAAADIEDHGVVEEVEAGEAKAVVDSCHIYINRSTVTYLVIIDVSIEGYGVSTLFTPLD